LLKIRQKIIKSLFDILFSVLGILLLGWMIIVLIMLSTIDTNSFGLFFQKRIGFKGKVFYVFKIRTMKVDKSISTTVTTIKDSRVTKIGSFLRKYKLDELPQLINILIRDMSFVGPRPDVEGFADKLEGEDRIVLNVKPGLTGPASLVFKHEEELLAEQENPVAYNRGVIWPQKVKINKEYIKNYTFKKDLEIIYKTMFNA